MKLRTLTLFAALALVLGLAATSAHAACTPDGSGTCPAPWMQDADGDGIPNGQDPDYVAPKDGTGNKYGRGGAQAAGLQNGNAYQWRSLLQLGHLRAVIGAFGMGPGTGTGVCDGSGPIGFGGFGKR